ncbi:MAG: ferrous iron transport protein B [Campylobacteraceae bacterium]|nr:ferrous iron transport protein B [Campylobacteraceae bacterium]
MIKVAFAGNPNVGKSALINAIAGSDLKVGNWPGVTIDKKEACFCYKGTTYSLVDLPGVYSLSPYSMEEVITRDYLLNEKPDLVINVLDSTNLERNLYLTYLLQELNIPMVLALNFSDEFEKLHFKLDKEKFEELIGAKTIFVSATKERGLIELFQSFSDIKEPNYRNIFPFEINSALERIAEIIKSHPKFEEITKKYNLKFLSIKILEDDIKALDDLEENFEFKVSDEILEIRKNLEELKDDDINSILASARYAALHGLLEQTLTRSSKSRLEMTERVDRFLLNRYIGFPMFFLIIAFMMGFVFNGSAPLIDFVDSFFVDFIGKYVAIFVDGTPEWMQSLWIDGIVAGLGGVLTFVPLMAFLYFFLAILEESGYMNRVAFLMDKVMRKLGLNGKAFVPMVIGFGCSVPAIYATKTLEDEKSRKLTAVMAPFMSCGARLPVYGLFTAAFFGAKAGLIVVSLYLLGIVVAILSGLFLKRFSAFKVDNKALLIELPPYRLPSLKVIVRSTSRRVKMYLKKAATAILAALMVLWALTYFPNNGDTKTSYMASFGRALQPILAPTGFADRWETAAAVVPSIAAKEIVVGFMAQVLPLVEESSEEEALTISLASDLKEQGENLIVALKDSFIGAFSPSSYFGLFLAPDEEEIEKEGRGVIQATKNLWSDDLAPLRAYSFMVFILLVVPCVVALAAIKQEFGVKFTLFVVGFMTAVPYVVSTLIFQIGRVFF